MVVVVPIVVVTPHQRTCNAPAAAPVGSYVGNDQRKRVMLKCPGSGIPDNPQPYVLTELVGGKPVQLVQQEADLIVYVNPEFRGIGGWESPPGYGEIMHIGTPYHVLQRYAPEAAYLQVHKIEQQTSKRK